MLSCGHTVCLSCLVRLIADNKDGKILKCPFEGTHKASDLPESIQADKISTIRPVFPSNYTLCRHLQSSDAAFFKPKCSRKECNGAPAMSFCVHCRKNLCGACAEYHTIFCAKHSAIPVNKYVPSLKDIEERAAKDATRKAAYEKSVKEAEEAKKKAEEEEAKKEAAEIDAINREKPNFGPLNGGESENKNSVLNKFKNEKAGPATTAEKENIFAGKSEKVNESKQKVSPRPGGITSPKPAPANDDVPPPANDDGPKPLMPRRPAATVRTAAANAGAAKANSGTSSPSHPATAGPRTSSTMRAPRPSGGESPLPEGWTELVDKKSGKKYYYNKMTKKTSWHKPTETSTSPASAEPISPPPADDAESPLPEGWSEVIDKKSGKKYYYNKTTKKTSWHRPEN